MSSLMEQTNIEKKDVFDLIIMLDESESMKIMGEEPIQSVNMYIKTFQSDAESSDATFTFVTFNTMMKTHRDSLLSDMKEIPEDIYNPSGYTALNDAICSTIKNILKSSKPDKKIFVIITYGEDNSSCNYTKNDVKDVIKLVEDKHDWKIVFLGANIDAFQEGVFMNISKDRTSQFNQDKYGDLLDLCRITSVAATKFSRARTTGYYDAQLKIPKRSNTEGGEHIFTDLVINDPICRPLPLRRTVKSDFYDFHRC